MSALDISLIVVGSVCLVVFVVCLLWFIKCYRNPINTTILCNMNWFKKFIYKNRLIISIVLTILFLACGIIMILMGCGVISAPSNPITN